MVRFFSIGVESASASVLLVPVLLACIQLFRRNMTALRKGLLVVFTIYLAAVFAATGMPSVINCAFGPRFNLVPLVECVHETPLYLMNTALNILLFIPFGFFVPLLWRQMRSAGKTALCGLAFSMFIEFAQMFSGRLTDIDDLIMNTTGAVIGFYLANLLYEKIAVAYDLHESGQHGTAELLSIILFTFIIMFCTQPFISGIIWRLL